MTIYTSYYKGEIKGEAVSISLYPPKGWTGKHLPLFAPTPELLHWWNKSAKDAAAQNEYKHRFRSLLDSRQQLIQLWVGKQKDNPVDMTLCCFEKTGDFCHRYQVGEEVVQKYLPELWGGEVGSIFGQMPSIAQNTLIETGHGSTDTPSVIKTSIAHRYDFTPINSTYPPIVQTLLAKCYDAGLKVRCDRNSCGYYHVSLHGEDLGQWSEMGVLSVLSGLQHEFYRPRLVPSLAAMSATGCAYTNELAAAPLREVPQQETKPASPSLITRLGKLEGAELALLQDWCKSVKSKMFPSVSQYADGRRELHLRRFVSLAGAKSEKKTVVKTVDSSMYPGAEMIEALGEKYWPDFHQALVLYYPAGTQIKIHRDSPAYASGAAQINVMGRARFSISGCQDVRKMESYWLEEGDCITFDNKQPHGIERVTSDRWCVCFFKLKAEYLESQKVEQLSLV